MPLTKVTLFLEQPREFATGQGRARSTYKHHGWTENYHLDSDVVGNSAAESVCIELTKKRAKLLPLAGFVKAVRMQKVDPVGKTKLIKAYAAGKVANGDEVASDDPNNCLLINALTAEGTNRRIITIRGIPDSILVGGYYNNVSSFAKDLREFCDYLQSNAFGFRGKDLSGAVRDIVNISGGIVTLKQGLSLSVGQTVQVLRTQAAGHRFKGHTGQVLAITDDKVFSLGTFPHGATTGGRLRVVPSTPYKYFAMTIDPRSVTNPEVSNRDTGSPSGRPRGRRSAKYA